MNKKIVGKIPQTKEIIHNCHVWDEPRFIDRMVYQKIDGFPILSNAVLFPKSKLTDLIDSGGGMGFSIGSMLINDKIKNVLKKFNLFGLQFFPTFIIHNNIKIEGYWQTHISEQAFSLLDFEKTDFILKIYDDLKVRFEKLDCINSLEDFLKCKENYIFPKELYFTNLILKKEKEFDYFFLPHYINGTGCGIISERLKNELKKNEITGIEYRPIEFSINEWLQGGERENFYGKL